MKSTCSISSLVISSVLLLSCDNSTTIELPKVPPKLAIGFVGENDQPWAGYVSVSKGILERDLFSIIENATVTIYENDQLTETILFNGNVNSLSSLGYRAQGASPKPGRSYRIQVSANPYEMVSASYIQPQEIEVNYLEITMFPFRDSDESRRGEFKVTLTDPDEENYYELFMVFTDGFHTNQIFIPEFIDPAYKENKEIFETTIFSDALFNGQKKTLLFKGDHLPTWLKSTDECRVFLRNLSKEYYLYLKTIHLQKIAAGDPFAQPVYVENNIQNGYGIFGGFTQSEKVFKIGN